MIYPNNGSSPADAQAAKRQRYEEALERAVGFEPGESKLSDDEILAQRAARPPVPRPRRALKSRASPAR